jgi:predicted nucleic-acid-binding protein
VRAIDTNVLARYLLNDDERQSAVARDMLAADTIIPLTVILETGWLLLSRYRLPRRTVAAALLAVVDLPSVHIDDEPAVRWALGRVEAGGDLADMLHLAGSQNATAFATFDRAISRAAGADSPVPIETLG